AEAEAVANAASPSESGAPPTVESRVAPPAPDVALPQEPGRAPLASAEFAPPAPAADPSSHAPPTALQGFLGDAFAPIAIAPEAGGSAPAAPAVVLVPENLPELDVPVPPPPPSLEVEAAVGPEDSAIALSISTEIAH